MYVCLCLFLCVIMHVIQYVNMATFVCRKVDTFFIVHDIHYLVM